MINHIKATGIVDYEPSLADNITTRISTYYQKVKVGNEINEGEYLQAVSQAIAIALSQKELKGINSKNEHVKRLTRIEDYLQKLCIELADYFTNHTLASGDSENQ